MSKTYNPDDYIIPEERNEKEAQEETREKTEPNYCLSCYYCCCMECPYYR